MRIGLIYFAWRIVAILLLSIRLFKNKHESILTIICKTSLLLTLLVFTQPSLAQQTRTLTGTIQLDYGVAERDYVIDVTVRNHSFVVFFPFTILRPITSEVTQQLVIKAGRFSASYHIAGIIEDPVDYTIQINCEACKQIIPTQYYSEGGNSFSALDNKIFIDPVELPLNLSIPLITNASIKGRIALENNETANRNLSYTMTVLSSNNPSLVYQTIKGVTLPQGSNGINYSILGLNRNTNGASYQVKLQCENCFGLSAKPIIYSRNLLSIENHTGIDFNVTDMAIVPIGAITELLLSD